MLAPCQLSPLQPWLRTQARLRRPFRGSRRHQDVSAIWDEVVVSHDLCSMS
jgi:hypothetical protein